MGPQYIQGGLLGTAQNYGYPMTSGLLGALTQSQAPDYTQQALQLAGNPHAGPYSTAGNLVQPGSSMPGGVPGSSGASSVAGGLLGTLAKNPALVKSGANLVSGLFGNGLGAYGSGAAANGAVTSALGGAGAQTAPTAASIQAANDAALAANGGTAGAGLLSMGALGSGAAADAGTTAALGTVAAQTAPEAATIAASNAAALGGSTAAAGSGAAAASGGAAGAGSAGLGAAAGALGLAALPLALAAFVPYNSGLSVSDINNMEQQVGNATKANGAPINAGYAMNPDGTINQANAQALTSLYTLLGDNPEEFMKAGGTGPVDQFLTGLGYGGLLSGGTPITAPAPGGRGWIGGNSRGTVRK